MSEKPDPLDGADVGQTETVRETVEMSVWDMTPCVYYGDDRRSDVTLEDVEVVGDGDNERVVLTYSGEVTKVLPRNWDYSREPLTESEARSQRRKKLLAKAAGVVSVLVPVVMATWISAHIMRAVAGEFTINGQPMPAISMTETFMIATAVLALSAIIGYGVQGNFPRVAGRRI